MKIVTIMQQNVRHWVTNEINLCNYNGNSDPNIILLNSHGCTMDQPINIYIYIVHQRNHTQEKNDGVAIAIKRNVNYVLIDDFEDEVIAAKVMTTLGDVIIATTYLLPRRNYLPAPDILKLMNYNCPVYILGDFNAHHHVFGNKNNNQVGNTLNTLLQTGHLIHLGPPFSTFIGH